MKRIESLDALRGVAAMLVVIQHVLELTVPQFWLLSWCNLGRLGVLLFFLISGFVVPFSLGGPRPLERFAISRMARLLPALWLSIGAMLLIAPTGAGPDLATVAANMTMLALPLGYEQLSSVYWTLSYELMFYLLVAALFVGGAMRQPRTIGLLLLCCIILAFTHQSGFIHAAFLLAGLLLRLDLLEREPSARPWTLACMAALMAGGLAMGLTQHSGNVFLDGWPRLLAFTLPLPIFLAVIVWRPRPGGALTYFGAISYSVYLFQAPVIHVLAPMANDNPALFGATVACATLLVAALVYELVEKPCIAFGRRLVRRPELVPA